MPEVTSQPPLVPLVENNPKLGDTMLSISEDNPDKSQPGLDVIRLRIGTLMDKIKLGYPNLPDNAFRAVSQLIAGPWLLPHKSNEPDYMQEDKELSARMQHEFVHHIFHATSGNATESYKKNVYFMIAAMERNADSMHAEKYLLRSFLSGVKSELAIARTFVDNGYRVVLPDYIKKSDSSKGKLSEALEWDVRSGVDLLAIGSDGTAFLIDAKGRLWGDETDSEGNRKIRTGVTIDDRVTLQGMTFLPQSLSTAVASLQQEAGNPQALVKRARIIIPTDPTLLGRLGTPKNSASYEEALDKFALLKPDLQADIISGLSNDG